MAMPSKGMVEGGVRPHHEEAVVECGASIPDSADDDARVSALLDEANKDIEQGQLRGGVDVRGPGRGPGADERRGQSSARGGARGARARCRGGDRVLARARARSR